MKSILLDGPDVCYGILQKLSCASNRGHTRIKPIFKRYLASASKSIL